MENATFAILRADEEEEPPRAIAALTSRLEGSLVASKGIAATS